MIFPRTLPFVTAYIPDTDQYYELPVFASRLNFALESYYQREAISGSKDYKPRGVRFDMSLSFDQTQNHDTLREFFNEMVETQNTEIRMYFSSQAGITDSEDYVSVINDAFAANLDYQNQIRKHGYSLNFTGKIIDEQAGVFFVITDDGDFVIDNQGQRIRVQVVL